MFLAFVRVKLVYILGLFCDVYLKLACRKTVLDSLFISARVIGFSFYKCQIQRSYISEKLSGLLFFFKISRIVYSFIICLLYISKLAT